MESYSMFFEGALLEGGFWLYIWDIQKPNERFLYVGRTGDSSSSNAASPFARIGHHLDLSPNAKANSIARRLNEKNVTPSSARFEMLAIGPLFPEQESLEYHVVYRDQMAALEKALAKHLRKNGYNVLGIHNSRKVVNQETLRGVVRIVNKRFPPISKEPKKKLSLIPTASLRNAGIASLDNAKALLDEAKLLSENAHYARALCLSTIGKEELGKAILFALAGLDLFPDLRERLSNSDWSNPALEHELKQLLEDYWGIAVWQVEEYHQILMDEIGWENWTPISDVEWLKELFVSIAKEDPSSADILQKRGKARKTMKKYMTKVPDGLTAEEEKHAGFYVDLKPDGSVSEPNCITEMRARLAIGELESGLNDFKRLERVFKNDEDWSSLEERLKNI
ncbi:MAG: AbiV family abortive infection protein [Desulfobacterales bacterium]|nr:AbiV family abortive infection protein [Desulfobacterales bacterium]